MATRLLSNDIEGALPRDPTISCCFGLLTEQIVKTDCDRCKLKTEHYVLDNGDSPMLCRCLRCGQTKRNPAFTTASKEPYPVDDGKPAYVS